MSYKCCFIEFCLFGVVFQRDLQDADRELASQMAEVLGSMRSLRVELEEDIAAEELADCGENDVDGEVLFRRNTN